MSRKYQLTLIVVFAIVAGLLMPLPTLAQEVTPEATPVIIAPPDPVTVIPVGDILELIGRIAVIAAAGGGILIFWDRLRRSKETKDTAEKLFEGLSPTWQTTITRIIDVADEANKRATELIHFMREVSDLKPNAQAAGDEQSLIDFATMNGFVVESAQGGRFVFRKANIINAPPVQPDDTQSAPPTFG